MSAVEKKTRPRPRKTQPPERHAAAAANAANAEPTPVSCCFTRLEPRFGSAVFYFSIYNSLSLYTALSANTLPSPVSLPLSGTSSEDESPSMFLLFPATPSPSASPSAFPTSGNNKTGPTEATAQIRTSRGSLEKSVAVTPKNEVRAAPAASPVFFFSYCDFQSARE